MADLYTTIVEAKWRYTLLVFISGFMLSWLGFGLCWYMIVRVHGTTCRRTSRIRSSCRAWTTCTRSLGPS